MNCLPQLYRCEGLSTVIAQRNHSPRSAKSVRPARISA